MKLMSLIKEGGKLFGPDAQRVTTDEMKTVFREISDDIGSYFSNLSLTHSLPSKTDHGDVDIVYTLRDGVGIDKVVARLGSKSVRTSRNGDVFSVLFKSNRIGKAVHVDFIHGKDDDHFSTKLQYFSLNDFSGIVGMLSKKMNFKYGSEGFFKRFRDKKGNWHDILVTMNLMEGLKCLGWNPTKFSSITDVDDIVDFVRSSPMFDSRFVSHEGLNQSDKKSYKRPVIKYVVDKLRLANQRATVSDEDYFFRKYFPRKYAEVQAIKDKIDAQVPVKSRYNGEYLIRTFNLKPGKQVGDILKYLSDVFGNKLDSTSENDVEKAVHDFLKR